eukprot:ctg_3059.g595
MPRRVAHERGGQRGLLVCYTVQRETTSPSSIGDAPSGERLGTLSLSIECGSVLDGDGRGRRIIRAGAAYHLAVVCGGGVVGAGGRSGSVPVRPAADAVGADAALSDAALYCGAWRRLAHAVSGCVGGVAVYATVAWSVFRGVRGWQAAVAGAARCGRDRPRGHCGCGRGGRAERIAAVDRAGGAEAASASARLLGAVERPPAIVAAGVSRDGAQ